MAGCQRRNTRQRQVVLQELQACRTHPTASELYRRVREQLPRISLGTVYRNLDILQEKGQAIRLAGLEGQEARYDGCAEPHLHFQCRDCGAIHDLAASWPPLDDLLGPTVEGHDVTGAQVLLYGCCRACRNGRDD
jgi:Fur family transcriptional regulator, ferric uptake regulator